MRRYIANASFNSSIALSLRWVFACIIDQCHGYIVVERIGVFLSKTTVNLRHLTILLLRLVEALGFTM